MAHRPFRITPVFLLLLWGISAAARGAVLSMPDQQVVPGQVVVAPLSFSSEGQAFSAIQFDIEWDAALDLKLVIGSQLRQSSKNVATAPGLRTVRCLVWGLNQDLLADGEVLRAYLMIASNANTPAQVRVINALGTDQDGNSMPLGTAGANIQVRSGSGNGSLESLPAAGVLNAASLLPGPLSPGEIITLLGNIPAGQQILINGVRATVLYSALNQTNAIVPFGLDSTAPATLEVRNPDRVFAATSVPAAPVAPAVFTYTGTGSGQGAILNQDFSTNSFDNPADRGSVIMIYGTGFGLMDPRPEDGKTAVDAAPTRLPVTASIGGLPADVLYAGAAPGLVNGVVQVNVRIPAGVVPSPAAPVILNAGADPTPAGVTVAVR